MKTKIILVLAIVANTAISIAQNIPSYVPKNGLVGWWPFNGNANDESGNGNNGTVAGATLTTDRDGVTNNAYNFDGNNQEIYVLHSTSLNSLPLTISVWFKTSNINKLAMLVNKYSGCSNNGYSLNLNTGHPSGYFYSPNNKGYINLDQSILDRPIVSDNEWHNAIMSVSNSGLKYYIDGILIDSKTFIGTASIPSSIENLHFGRYPQGNCSQQDQYYYTGLIDDIAIFNRSLTQEEITGLFSRCSGTIATITPKSTTTFCDGASVDLEANSSSNYTYQWYKNNQLINSASLSTYKATTTGKYSVIVTDGACSDTSDITNVTVNSNPSVSINSFGSVVYKSSNVLLLQGNPTGGTFTGSGVTGMNLDPTKVALGKRSVSYSYTTPEGCNGSASKSYILADTLGNVCSTYDTLKINFKLTTGIKANELTTVSAYPNPTSDVLFIEASDIAALNGYAYRIVDLQGKELYKKSVEKAITQISLNTLGAKGVYILHILDGNGSSVENKKIVLQ